MDDADAMGSQKYPRRRLNPRRVLLAALVCIVITVVLLQQLGICSSPPAEPSAASAMPGAGRASMASTRAPPPAWAAATHLIMVAGHAVLTASAQTDSNVQLESSWYLEPFQHGQLRTMLLHIRRGDVSKRRKEFANSGRFITESFFARALAATHL